MPLHTHRAQAAGPSHADIVKRLHVDFKTQQPLPVIVALIQRSRRNLDTAPGPAPPALVERRARQRVHDLAGPST